MADDRRASHGARPASSTGPEPAREAAARRLHGRGVAATGDGRPVAGARHLRRGLALLDWSEERPAGPGTGSAGAIVGRLLISLAYAEAEQGRTAYGFHLLDLAARQVAPRDRGVLLQQRALLLYRTGRYTEAMPYFDEAIPLLASADHIGVLCPTLLNRASVHLHAGRVRAAREDLIHCERLARRHHIDVLVAKAMHNRGYCELLAGDLPGSLAAFAAAEQLYRRHALNFLPVLTAAKGRALLTAGLCHEAAGALEEAIVAFRRQRLTEEQAEAELFRSQASLYAGDHAVAARWAGRAERRFRRRGNVTWADLAALTQLRAALAQTRQPRPLAVRAARVAARLRQAGLAQDAELADLIAVRALVAAGRPGAAHDHAAAMPKSRPPAPLELLLARRITRAELAASRRDNDRALSEIRAGLSVLRQRRSRLGSVDLQAGITALGRELATFGLNAAFDRGSPTAVLVWSERARAQAFQVPAVHPPSDPRAAEAVAELRQLRHLVRTAGGPRHHGADARRRIAELERLIRERDWQVGGPGHSDRICEPSRVMAELGAADRLLVSLVTRRGRLAALLVDARGVRMVELGDHAVVREAHARLLADLDALAGSRPPPLAAVIRDSLRRNVATLGEGLTRPLRPTLADRELVIVPTMGLASLPWGLMPELVGRPVTVAPSASAWLAALHAPAADRVGAGAVLLVAGPDLLGAEAELAEVATSYPGSRCLTGAEATVADTLRALDGASVAHIAAHGHHEPGNVLFSRLDLVDGPLMAYDVQHLDRAPRHVTLSACDVGRAVVRPGDEVLGFTAALLYVGTPSVVASVARVTHAGAAAVMSRYHRALAAGAEPARALADASRADPLAPFVCFGAG